MIEDSITLIEVGLRDGLQLEKKIVPTNLKAALIEALIDAGLRHFQITALVHPKRVPQMADAEALIAALPKHADVEYNALVLNPKGLNRALQTGITSVEVSASISDAHSLENMGKSSNEAIRSVIDMIGIAKTNGCRVRSGIQCAFGCAYEGKIPIDRVLKTAEQYLSAGTDTLSIADTTGMATPDTVNALLNRLLPLTAQIPVILHLHDTNGMGMQNLRAGFEMGVTHFDTAIGGLGGCPFIPHAPGNIATEIALSWFNRMNVLTGIDEEKVRACAERMISFLNSA